MEINEAAKRISAPSDANNTQNYSPAGEVKND